MTALAGLLGLSDDEAKAVSNALLMKVLGTRVLLHFALRTVTLGVEPAKAHKWARGLVRNLFEGTMPQEAAQKAAGRFSFAVTVSGQRVGRAQAKALHMQANAPLSGARISDRLATSLVWWVWWLLLTPDTSHVAGRRKRALRRTWSDASGADAMVAVFVYLEEDAQWHWTSMLVPDDIAKQLLPRGDHQIGYQELIAPTLALYTWPEWFVDCLWSGYMDNQGALLGLIGGSSNSPEQNCVCGRFLVGAGEATRRLPRVTRREQSECC